MKSRLRSVWAVALLGLLPAPVAWALPTLTWAMREFPPLTIFDGPQKGQGAVDQMLAQLTQAMPGYQHKFVRVNRARGIQMLKETRLTCDPTLLWTAERASFAAFSVRAFATQSNGLIIRAQDQDLFTPWLHEGSVNLAALLKAGNLQVGIVPGRSYGQAVDAMLGQAPAQVLVPHYGNDASTNLLQMEQLGRLHAFLGYWTEARYLAAQQGIDPATLRYLPIQGDSRYKFTYVACSNTPEGHQAIDSINARLKALRQTSLPLLYARWLDSGQQREYLEDARRFFEHPDDTHP